MKKYFLIVMFPATSEGLGERHQQRTTTVEAERVEFSEAGCYLFYDGKGLKAAYPINYTIIDKIENR